MPPDDDSITLRTYLEEKFRNLERHIDDKFGYQHDINKDVDKRISYLEINRIPNLENKIDANAKRAAYIDGALMVIIALAYLVWGRA